MSGRKQLVVFLKDCGSPLWGAIKWQAFTQLILEISRCEIGAEDVLMYLPAAIAAIDDLRRNKSNPTLATHAILATVHNLRGHRFLPYIDPKLGYHCNINPAEDVFYHGLMLGFVDYSVQKKFPTPLLNKVYDHVSRLMKVGIAYSMYLAFRFGSDAEACKSFVPSLATSSVPMGTAFSLLAMWNFPFNHPTKFNRNQLLAYTAVMYFVSTAMSLLLFFENKNGNKFAREMAGKYFESYFIAGASLKGLEIIGEYLLHQTKSLFSSRSHTPLKSISAVSTSTLSAAPAKPVQVIASDQARKISPCHRFRLFTLDVIDTAKNFGKNLQELKPTLFPMAQNIFRSAAWSLLPVPQVSNAAFGLYQLLRRVFLQKNLSLQ